MSDISNQLIKDSFNYVLQADLITGVIFRIGGTIPQNPKFQSGLTVNTSFTYSNGTEFPGYVLTCDALGNGIWAPVSGSSSSVVVTGGTFDYSNGTLELRNSNGSSVTIPGLEDIYITGGTVSGSSIFFTYNDTSTFEISGITSISTFNSYTANTENILNSKVSISTYSAYTATTEPLILNSVTGGTYSGGTLYLVNNSGNTVQITGFSTSTATNFTGGTVTGATNFTDGLTANTISATTYFNLPTDVFVTGFTYNDANQFTIKQNEGQPDLNVSFNIVTGLTTDYFDFNANPTPNVADAETRLKWNDQDGTLDLGLKGGNVTLQIGQKEVIRVVNKTNSNLLKANYQVVRVRTQSEGGAQGQRLAVVLAQANNKANHTGVLGLVSENIQNNQEGFISTFGIVRNINTTGNLQGETWLDGDVLWLSDTTAGRLTNIEPQTHPVQIGYVVYAHQNNGKIFVKINEGVDELNELHDVNVSGVTDGQVLTYSASTQTWVPTTVGGTVLTDDSIQGDGTLGNEIKLVNDATTPGVNKVYGTDNAGNRGWRNELVTPAGVIPGTVVGTFPAKTNSVTHLVVGSADRLYVPSVSLNIVDVYEASSGDYLGTLSITGAYSCIYVASLNEVWVSSSSSLMTRLDPSTFVPLGTFTGATNVLSYAEVSSTKIYLATVGNTIVEVDPSALTVTATITAASLGVTNIRYITYVNNPLSLHFQYLAGVCPSQNEFYALNTTTNGVVIAGTNFGGTLGSPPTGIAYNSVEDNYYISLAQNQQVRIFKPTSPTVATFQSRKQATFCNNLVFDPVTQKVYTNCIQAQNGIGNANLYVQCIDENNLYWTTLTPSVNIEASFSRSYISLDSVNGYVYIAGTTLLTGTIDISKVKI